MKSGKLLARVAVQTVVWLAFMALLLLLPAGNWRWPQGWAFLAIFGFGSVGFTFWLLPRDPALLASRVGPLTQRGQPLWDKIFLILFISLWCGWLVLMALDAQRWHLSHMPPSLNVLGALLVVAGFLATMFVFRENSFAAPVIRVQTEREQRVIDSGPYSMVRHPMYASALLYLFGLPLLLGSWYGILIVPLFIIGIARRAVSEERVLERELPGYTDYKSRVRWRLIPYVF
jgi:protein-S-isoprenylcysteine O-methyltransferase Ste14